jgi:hypothetical protein
MKNQMDKKFNIGDRVIKNPDGWIPNDFDGWGRGVGVGIIVEPPFELDEGDYDVRWPGGRCFERESQLLPNLKTPMEEREWNYSFTEGDEVMFAPDLPDSYFESVGEFLEDTFLDLRKFKDYRGQKGIVKKCWSDLHAFGRGSSYMCEVHFDGLVHSTMCQFYVKYEKSND